MFREGADKHLRIDDGRRSKKSKCSPEPMVMIICRILACMHIIQRHGMDFASISTGLWPTRRIHARAVHMY